VQKYLNVCARNHDVRRCDSVRAERVAALSREKVASGCRAMGEQIQLSIVTRCLPQLTQAERNALGAVKIEVSAFRANGDPFSFYTDDKGTIYLPALSLRFLFGSLRGECLAQCSRIRWNHGARLCRRAPTRGNASRRASACRGFSHLGVPDNAREEKRMSQIA